MNQSQYSQLFSFLWNIANDVLVQAFEKGDYKKVTLPFIVLRRLDVLLEDTKETVLNCCESPEFKNLPEESKEQQLCIIYTPVELRSREEIIAEIREIESRTDGLLNEIIRG